jgi:hypothetical protein
MRTLSSATSTFGKTGGEERFLPAGAEPLRGEDALALSLERLLG